MLTSLLRVPSAKFSCALALAIAAFCATRLGGQTTPVGSANPTGTPAPAAGTPSAAAQSLNIVTEGIYEHIFSANLKNGGSGSMASNRFAIAGQTSHDWDADHLKAALLYDYQNYDFSSSPSPFGNVQRLGANLLYSHDFNNTWGAFTFLSAGFSAETAASLTDGEQIAIAAGPVYNVNRVLSVSAGPMYYSRMEDEDTWTPYAQAKWAVAPQWEVRGYLGAANGASVSYDLNGDQVTVFDASLDYSSDWFRLRDQPGIKSAVNESYGELKFGVRQGVAQNVFVRGYIAYLFSREYQFHVNGNSTNSFDVNSSWGLGLEIGAVF